MKFYLIFGSILNFLFGIGNEPMKTENKFQVVHQAMNEAAKEIQTKYNLNFGGISEQTDKDNNNKYEHIGLMFNSSQYISKEEARKIVLGINEIFLSKLNTERVKPYLTVFPFTEKNIHTCITFRISKKNWDHSQISTFGFHFGKVFYWYDIPNEKYKTRKEEESYSEALKILEQGS